MILLVMASLTASGLLLRVVDLVTWGPGSSGPCNGPAIQVWTVSAPDGMIWLVGRPSLAGVSQGLVGGGDASCWPCALLSLSV